MFTQNLSLVYIQQMGGLECVITGLLDQARASGAHWLRREHFTLFVVCVSFCVACINVTPVCICDVVSLI